eukprot:360874-Chlamydomonas_euryale.AAC.25
MLGNSVTTYSPSRDVWLAHSLAPPSPALWSKDYFHDAIAVFEARDSAPGGAGGDVATHVPPQEDCMGRSQNSGELLPTMRKSEQRAGSSQQLAAATKAGTAVSLLLLLRKYLRDAYKLDETRVVLFSSGGTARKSEEQRSVATKVCPSTSTKGGGVFEVSFSPSSMLCSS